MTTVLGDIKKSIQDIINPGFWYYKKVENLWITGLMWQ